MTRWPVLPQVLGNGSPALSQLFLESHHGVQMLQGGAGLSPANQVRYQLDDHGSVDLVGS